MSHFVKGGLRGILSIRFVVLRSSATKNLPVVYELRSPNDRKILATV